MSNGNIFPIRQDMQQGAQGPDPGQQGWGWGPWGPHAENPIWPPPQGWQGGPSPWWGQSPHCHGMEGFRHGFGCCCPQCKPICPPPNFCVVPCPPRAISGPIIGVTDGSNAAPGQVGEFLEFSVNVPFPAYPANITTSVSVAVIQPGDWDFQAACGPQGGNLRAIDFLLEPKPLGMNDAMRGTLFITVASSGMFCGLNDSVVVSQRSRGSFAVPTLMAFTLILDNSGDPNSVASFVEMDMTARRMR